SLFAFVLVTFNFVSAQQTNLSFTCQQEIIKVGSSSDLNSCASFLKLAPLQNATNSTPVFDSYCSLPKCNDNTISSYATELKTQCATVLVAKDPIIFNIKQSLVFNAPMRDAFCFKNSSGGYCDLDPNTDIMLGYLLGFSATPPTDINCTDCNKAILSTFVNYFNAHPESLAELPADPTSFETMVKTKCGASFLDGNIPFSTISSVPSYKETQTNQLDSSYKHGILIGVGVGAGAKPIYDSYCYAPKCNDSITSANASELKTQCQSDLAAKGYCNLDPNSAVILGYIGGLSPTPPTDITCNGCNKAILNIFLNYKSHPDIMVDLPVN
ncbi:4837_t:CDS:2, partial [Dentiscutata erythropus]